MNFFEYQDTARRNTKYLVLFFALAVALIVAAVYAVAVAVEFYFLQKTGTPLPATELWRDPKLFLQVAGGTVAVILLGSLYMTAQLSGGGSKVAEMLGGRKLDLHTTDANERKLRNVVEEMAIASGTPVPEIYLLDGEAGINAFAAGFTPSDAAIGVTRGAVETLNRSELQGVIAHEFSHIFHGDMRLNIRLIGVLHGILLIAMIGSIAMRMGSPSRVSYGSRRKGNGMPIVLVGLGLFAIGYIGVFFGKLIKSAVSRQREYLADASAVQFTRDPQGLAGALKKIAAFDEGSRIRSSSAETASHMFFGNALGTAFLNLLATHPPVEERIKRLEPSFDGTVPALTRAPVEDGSPVSRAAPGSRVATDQVFVQIGSPSAAHLAYAGAFVGALPESVVEATRETFGARAVVYALLLNAENEVREKQLAHLRNRGDASSFGSLMKLTPAIGVLGPEARLPLVDLALPALRQLSPKQYDAFIQDVVALIGADRRVELHEMVLAKVLIHNLEAAFRRPSAPARTYRSFDSVASEASILLSALAHVGSNGSDSAQLAFQTGWTKLSRQATTILPAESCDVTSVNRAIDRLAIASPSLKQEILEAAASAVGSDGKVTTQEAELLRALGDTLHCPVPPILS